MINFDGAILMDLVSVSTPPNSPHAVDYVHGIEIWGHRLLPEADRYDTVCEGCGASPWNGSMFPIYRSHPLSKSNDTMCPSLDYCQACMEGILASYEDNPYKISAAGGPPFGAEWFQPVFVSGHPNNEWKHFQ